MMLTRISRVVFVFPLLVAVALVACSSDDEGSSGGASSSGGSSSGGSPSGGSSSGGSSSGKTGGSSSGETTSSSGSTTSASCCVGKSYYACPSENDANDCFNKGSAGACQRESSKDSKCCSSQGFSCSTGSDCCSGKCVDDPESEGDKICE